jgi:hypothetical protein
MQLLGQAKGLLLLLLLGFCLLPVQAQLPTSQSNNQLTLQVPIPLHAVTLPEQPTQASQLFTVFGQPALAPRIEAIRRAALYLRGTERKAFYTFLTARREANPNDPNLYFDVGYADVALNMNKTGLFFLRKASERLRDPFALVAYAMAQADVDLLAERSLPANPSIRKLDVVYKLSDAIALDVKQHRPGLWPTFVRIQQHLAQYPAYADFSARDYSDSYVPFGERPSLYAPRTDGISCTLAPVAPPPSAAAPKQPKPIRRSGKPASKPDRDKLKLPSPLEPHVVGSNPTPTVGNASERSERNDVIVDVASAPSLIHEPTRGSSSVVSGERPLFSQPVALISGATTPQCVDFFQLGAAAGATHNGPQPYKVRVRQAASHTGNADGTSSLLGSIQAPLGIGVLEDLERDGVYELVVRQFRIAPFQPILVYRVSATAVQLDTTVQQWFE